jgi:hypothetical protein
LLSSSSLSAKRTTPLGNRILNRAIFFSSCFFLNFDRIPETDFSSAMSIVLSQFSQNVFGGRIKT